MAAALPAYSLGFGLDPAPFEESRAALVRYQERFTSNIYGDLFEKYKPQLVVASTPGWREDRYLLREAAAHHTPTASIILGWDNPSSYALPGAPVDKITCWSDIQRDELVLGSDWDAGDIHIGGIPIYDGYFDRRWSMDKDKYFQVHGSDPKRKLTFVCLQLCKLFAKLSECEGARGSG